MEKLNDKELENVAGGKRFPEELKFHLGTKVGKYNLVVGKKYIAIYFSNIDRYYVGVCTKTFEDKNFCGTIRTHILREDSGREVEVNGNYYNMYEYID